MAESPDHADGDKTDPINNGANDPAATPGMEGSAGSAASASGDLHKNLASNLPMVLSPKLGAGEDETVEDAETPDKEAAEATAAAAASPTQSSRFLQLAATIAFIAAFSSFVGSVSGAGFAHFYYPNTAAAPKVQVSTDTMSLQQVKAELAALKAEVDTTMRGTNGQYSKIADRLDRLDQHFASADVTGSIASSAAPAATQPKITDRILQDWAVRDVQNGRALIESRYGGVFDVGTGSFLPGIGRVDSIKRQDGQWLVVTSRGTITSGR
ncbi:MAG TPA: hypothetical protein VMA30_08905 [Xanthobacteraceae bacterium]|nr:hypothetical protein [Xanthobacteraceae bacterium]